MSRRELTLEGCEQPIFKWGEEGALLFGPGFTGMHRRFIPAAIAWLQEGPPQKRYRITRTFDERPDYVECLDTSPSTRLNIPIAASDLEEVWE